METLKKTIQIGFGLALLGGILYGLFWILPKVWSRVQEMDGTVVAAIITSGFVVTSAIWAKYLERRHSVESQFRRSKVKLFNDFMESLEALSREGEEIEQDKLLNKIREWKRRTLFWCGPKVMHGFLSLGELEHDQTVGGMAQSIEIIGNLILEMRKDVGLSNRGIVTNVPTGISEGTVLAARYMLRYPNVFLSALKANPSMKISDLP